MKRLIYAHFCLKLIFHSSRCSTAKKDFPIGPASQNKNTFYCHPCQKVISCGHMGRGDVARHCDPKGDTIHNKNVKSIKKSARINQFLVSKVV